MDGQRYAIGGRVVDAEDPELQRLLAQAHEAPARPRCLCVSGGVEMYVALHRQYLVKRMPDTGHLHHPGCPSYEPGPSASGLGELAGEAIVPLDPSRVALHVDFPWECGPTKSVVHEAGDPRPEAARSRRRMSLGALTHFLFERAGFNRWVPAMAGRRHQAVLHRHLVLAAEEAQVQGEPLARRLLVPEASREDRQAEQAERRQARLAALAPREGRHPMMVVLGEFKACEPGWTGQRVWIRHLPDTPLHLEPPVWRSLQRRGAPLFEAMDADGGHRLHLVLAALIRARGEGAYAIERASLMLASDEWIPLDGAHEVPLVRALVAQGRRFVKPLRYDARSAAAYANVLLLDAGPQPVALHLLSGFMKPADRALKERVIQATAAPVWVWATDEPMPVLPPRAVG